MEDIFDVTTTISTDASLQPPAGAAALEFQESPNKRMKLDHESQAPVDDRSIRQRGVAPIKLEYLLFPSNPKALDQPPQINSRAPELSNNGSAQGERKKKDRKEKKQKGQNKSREFGSSRDALPLCSSVALQPEFSPLECKFGTSCRFEHDLRRYLAQGKREDLKTFDGICPVWKVKGTCNNGWKCRFVGSHSEERSVDGKRELVLIEDVVSKAEAGKMDNIEGGIGLVNVVTTEQKFNLNRRRVKTPKADAYLEWESSLGKSTRQVHGSEEGVENEVQEEKIDGADGKSEDTHDNPGNLQSSEQGAGADKNESKEDAKTRNAREDHRAEFFEAKFLPSEKRRIYYGPETAVLAPLTTQGNVPFRRLCVDIGAQVTWSEMAMGLPLLQGAKTEWALTKAHESEITPPRFTQAMDAAAGYDNSRDLKFGVQIAANKPWLAVKTTEVLTSYCPYLRAIDLNCGCPIDLVYRQGSGSALLESHNKLEKMLRGMNAVSGEVPITVKIRMGSRDNQPTAEKLINRLIMGGPESPGPCGVAAITLHGRSRQQRYTKSADWSYISDCAALIQRLKHSKDNEIDTSTATDPRDQPNGGKVYFLGNGDCFSHFDYYSHIKKAKVDSVMVARGALIKPWIFEEIEKGMYLDKSASERLEYIKKFARYGLETWGSDEMGIGTTRRFLLEWLSFSCRYVPIGLLEYLPPRIQDRPSSFRGRSDLETLLSSDNYRDWVKISEMFLGPAHPDFRFEPKHKSNSYEETEG